MLHHFLHRGGQRIAPLAGQSTRLYASQPEFAYKSPVRHLLEQAASFSGVPKVYCSLLQVYFCLTPELVGCAVC